MLIKPLSLALVALHLSSTLAAPYNSGALEVRADAYCSSGIYGELLPYISPYIIAQIWCDDVFPVPCTTAQKEKRNVVSSTTTAAKTTTANVADAQASAWSRCQQQDINTIESFCYCMETTKACPVTSTTTKSTTATTAKPATTTTVTTTKSSSSTSTTTKPSTTTTTTKSQTTNAITTTTTTSTSITTATTIPVVSTTTGTTPSTTTTTVPSTTTTTSTTTTATTTSSTGTTSSTTTPSPTTTTTTTTAPSTTTTTTTTSTTDTTTTTTTTETTTATTTTTGPATPTCSFCDITSIIGNDAYLLQFETCQQFDQNFDSGAGVFYSQQYSPDTDDCTAITNCSGATDNTGNGVSFRVYYDKINGYWQCDVGALSYSSSEANNQPDAGIGNQYVYSG